MIRIAVALAASLVLTACGDEGDAFPIDPAGPPELPSGEFIAPELPEPFAAGDRLRVSFTRDSISFSATCNQMSGNADVVDGVLQVSSVGGTEMGCPGAGFDQDEWLVDFFTSSPSIEHEDVGFTLSTADTTVRFLVPDAVPDAVELEGTVWTLTGIEETSGDSVGIMGVPGKVEATLTIEGQRMLVRAGCNSGSADVLVSDDRLELGPLALTKMACAGVAGEVERGVLQVLDGSPLVWRINGTQLRLENGDHALVYDAE